jgi:hypothetical protein
VETQATYRVNGRVRRVDFLIRRPGRLPNVVIEFDGIGKYGDTLPLVLRSVWEEKRRQMDLESLGLVFLRFVMRRCGMVRAPRACRALAV